MIASAGSAGEGTAVVSPFGGTTELAACASAWISLGDRLPFLSATASSSLDIFSFPSSSSNSDISLWSSAYSRSSSRIPRTIWSLYRAYSRSTSIASFSLCSIPSLIVDNAGPGSFLFFDPFWLSSAELSCSLFNSSRRSFKYNSRRASNLSLAGS